MLGSCDKYPMPRRARLYMGCLVISRALEEDLTFVGPDHAHDHPKRGRLAGPIATEQADDTALVNRDRDLIHDGPARIPFDQVPRFEKGYAYQNCTSHLRLSFRKPHYITPKGTSKPHFMPIRPVRRPRREPRSINLLAFQGLFCY